MSELKWNSGDLPMINGLYLVTPGICGASLESWEGASIVFAEVYGCEVGMRPMLEVGGVHYKLKDQHQTGFTHWLGPIPEPPSPLTESAE